jgi:hypothetical protein
MMVTMRGGISQSAPQVEREKKNRRKESHVRIV